MKHKLLILCLAALLMFSLCGCQDYTEDVTEFAMIAESGDLSALDAYPNLEYVDLRGSTCYDEILSYAKAHPHVTVRYNVDLGSAKFNQDVTEIQLYADDFRFDTMLENLRYLPELQSLRLIHTDLGAGQLETLISTYPHIDISYNVKYSGHEYECTDAELDLSYISPEDVPHVVSVLAVLPDVTDVHLSSGSGDSHLEISDVKVLVDAYPDITFHYNFTLFGQRLSINDPQMIFDEVPIGNDGVPKIRAALDVMKHCSYVVLDSCKIDDSVMAQLRDDYPEKEIVWRIFVDRYSLLTNEEMIRMTAKLTDENTKPLKYCTKVKYLDINYNVLTDISFVSYMPELECAILNLTQVSDLSPLTNCQKLLWLELFSCSKLEDISCLAEIKSLKYLNIAQTDVSDISCLDNLPLERFVCTKSKVTNKSFEAFVNKHPDCMAVNKNSTVGYGWRYNEPNQSDPFEYYLKMEEVFRYKDKNYKGNRKE